MTSNKANKITPSLTLETTAKAKKMRDEGVSVIGFGAGEPDFATPQYICDAAKKAIDIGFTKYTSASGIIELKDAICRKLWKDNGLKYNIKNIVVSSGAKSSIFHAIGALINEGDEIILPSPYWLTYPESISLWGGITIFAKCDKNDDYKLTPALLEGLITKKTKCVIINSPNNPTGAIYNEKELKALAAVIEKYGIYTISDEVYEKLIYCGEQHCSIAGISDYMREHTIVVNGVSKAFAMTGWRIGYVAAPEEIAKAISDLQSHTTSNACSISQYASVEALTSPQSDAFVEEMRAVFDERREIMVNFLDTIKGVSFIKPKGAFYIFVDVSSCYGKRYKGNLIDSSLSFTECALKNGVAVVPGKAFGDDNCIRLSYAIAMTDIKEGLKRLKNFIYALI